MKHLPSFKKHPFVTLGVIALAAIPALSLAATPGATLETRQAESAAVGTGTSVMADGAASGGAKLAMFANSSMAFVGIKGSVESITVRAHATDCMGSPQVWVRLNGVSVANRFVKESGGWTTMTTEITPTPNSDNHVVTVSFVNDRWIQGVCDRNVFVDDVQIRATHATTPTTTPTTPTTPPAPSEVKRLYVNPNNPAAVHADRIRATDPTSAALLDKIGDRSQGVWVGGYSGDSQQLAAAVAGAKATKSRLVLVIYGIPFRDGGGYSSGGFANAAGYKQWIDRMAALVGSTPAITLIEPDAVAMDVPVALRAERNELLRYATATMNALPDNKVYLDGGTSAWRTSASMITRLKAAGVDAADGFTLNVSNFQALKTEINYGFEILAGVGPGKGFVVDTSRNGNGPLLDAIGEDAWCNPPGRALGVPPTMATGVPNVDAFVWAKTPGTSDGACRGLPSAGTFVPAVALELARLSK